MIKIVFRKIKSPIFNINIALNIKFKENLFPGYKNILGWGYYSRGVFIRSFTVTGSAIPDTIFALLQLHPMSSSTCGICSFVEL